METVKIKRLNKWANAHTHYSIDLLRIALGVFLFIKGVSFITNNQQLEDALAPLSNFSTGGMVIFHYVAAAHLMGGVLIVFGLITRWAIWAQLPILLGAVIISFFGTVTVGSVLLPLITLIVCVFFLIYGSGKHSADYFFKMQK
jgi:uncharacterized membrane protein YphA (DoxX/SURF4 family)